MRSFARYAVAIALGAGVDFGVAAAFARSAGIEVAATLGFGAGLALNYLVFEYWVFGDKRRARLSAVRFFLSLLVASVALGVRLAVIAGLGVVFDQMPEMNLVRIALAMVCSAIVNYLLVRAVFRPNEQ